MANTAQIDITVSVQDNKTVGLGIYNGNPKIVASLGLSSAQAAKRFTKQVTTGSGTSYDVTTGLTDAFGTALTFATVNAVAIYNTGAASLTVGGGSNPLFGSDQYTVKAGQCLVIPNVPITVSGSVKTVHIVPAASTTWQIAILGA
ncbi:hypothetical protein GobsT_18560 [Gemmata obscuriglobus]|uniref:Uncharacterized protein n=1 Tax=Gemmata obscuriglobus TaxID=114 RepID=A0A2Z3H632_9BACT|nr:hypothetical protein [Gemmata obscuriglobus]AWM39782.1 hypothetical protein C1280_24105 [Gemmata obscuriglobus]QEG27103.1 hypothetical protein GobsT_18560 [Gemmata obscuriglobus]VTS03604.1 unnamed protein product [Gemmata obscuriglobus UQM 2246]